MAGGQSHAYQLSLKAGQFLQVIVEQRDIDVVVRLLKSDGTKLVERNGRWYEPETLSLFVESSGQHRLEVNAREKSPARSYQIQLAESQTPSQQAIQQITAEQASTEAKSSFLQGTPASRRKAVKQFEAALR